MGTAALVNMSGRTDKLSLLLGCKMMRLSLESSRLQAAQRDALNAEHSNIRGSLNIDTMVQFLNSKSLLTSDESYWLMDTNRPWGKRVDFLVEILPRKESDWWDKFLWCLDESSTRPGLAVHKQLANQLRDQLNQQTRKYERCNLMWLPIKYLKRFTVRHQKTAYKIGTIVALLVVAFCILIRPNTLIVNNERSEWLSMSSIYDNMKKFVSDKANGTKCSFQGDIALRIGTAQNIINTDNSEQTLIGTNLNQAHITKHTESLTTNNDTHYTLVTSPKSSNKRSIIMQNTSEYAVAHQKKVHQKQSKRQAAIGKKRHQTMTQLNDMEVMQKQLNMTHCLLYFIEKEKMEYAELDLWRVYIAFYAIPPTATKRRILSVMERLIDCNIDLTLSKQFTNKDLTISRIIENKLASTKQAIDNLKNLLTMTDVTMMRKAQYSCKLDHHVMLEQLVNNYETENKLLNLKHELYAYRPRVEFNSNTSVFVPFLYYPVLERYVSLAVDTFSAKKTCLKVCNLV